MPFMVVNMMMTAPVRFLADGEIFFLMWFQQNPFLSHIFSSVFFCRWIGFDLQNMDFVGNYPTEEKVNNAKVQIYQPLSSCFNSNSTFHDTAMCIGHLVNFTMEQWKIDLGKMVQVEDWLTHYLTQFNGERPDMVSVI